MLHISCKKLLALLFMGVFMSSTYLAMANPNIPSTEKTGAGAVPNFEALLTSKAKVSVLENGLTVYILEDHRFPLVSTRLYVRAGSSYETPQDAGISHVLEHMVFKGTEKRPMGAIAREIEEVGGYLNAATSFDYTVYITDVPSKHWALGMDIVKDMAFHPTLDAAELASEKKVILSELQMGNDNPHQRVFKELHSQALRGTPYDHSIIGFEETINAVTPESMRQYIAQYYHPQNMFLIVVGDVDAKAVLEESNKLFGDLKNSSDMTPRTAIDASKLYNTHVTVLEGNWNKVYLGLALPVPGLMDAQTYDLDVLAHVLGGDATSYLYKKYKYDKQLVDAISLSNYSFERVGMLYFTIQLDAKNVETFWKEFVADLATLKASVFSQKDIDRAKLLIEDSTQRTKETLGGLASYLGYLNLFLGGAQGEKNALDKLQTITPRQLQNVMDQWLVPERMNVTALVPQGTKLPDLEAALQAAWPATAKKSTANTTKAAGTTQVIDLGNQCKVVLIPDTTLPYTSVDLYFSGGTALSDQKQGLATLAASVLTSGTKSMTSPQMEEYLAERAAGLGAHSGRQVFWLSTNQPSKFNKDIFALLRDVLVNSTLSAEEMEREKKNQVAAIRSRDDHPTSYLFSEVAPFLFGKEHPYGLKTLGTIQEVESYTREDIVAFWKKQAEQPWVLSVAGDFDQESVLAFAKTLPQPKAQSPQVNAPTWGTKQTLDLHMPGREQAHLLHVFPTVPSEHQDAAALELLHLVLSGQSGILFQELREKQGLAYTTYAAQQFFPKTGIFVLYIGTQADKLAQSRDGFEKVLTGVQEDLLSEAALQRAKNQMESSYYRGRQSLASRSNEGAMRLILGQDLDFRKDFIEKAKKLTVQDLQKVAKKYLQWDKGYTFTLKP